MIEGAKMMAQNWWVGGAALLGTSLLLTNRIIPAMFLLLLFGAAYGMLNDPTLFAALRQVHMELRVPTFALSSMTFSDFVVGSLFLVPHRTWPDLQRMKLPATLVLVSSAQRSVFPWCIKPAF